MMFFNNKNAFVWTRLPISLEARTLACRCCYTPMYFAFYVGTTCNFGRFFFDNYYWNPSTSWARLNKQMISVQHFIQATWIWAAFLRRMSADLAAWFRLRVVLSSTGKIQHNIKDGCPTRKGKCERVRLVPAGDAAFQERLWGIQRTPKVRRCSE